MVTENSKYGRGGGADMWRYKGCPKCGGDLFLDHDVNGWFQECLQCGYMHDLKTILEVREEKPAKAQRNQELAIAGHHKRATTINLLKPFSV